MRFSPRRTGVLSTPYSAGDASEESSHTHAHTHAHTRFIQAEEEEKEGDDETSGFVDVTAPHPEFVLSPPNTRVSSREFEDICEDLAPPNGKGELKNPQHPFLRALRRGAESVCHFFALLLLLL